MLPSSLSQKSTLDKAGGGASEATAQDERFASPTTVSKLKDRLESENLTASGLGSCQLPNLATVLMVLYSVLLIKCLLEFWAKRPYKTSVWGKEDRHAHYSGHSQMSLSKVGES